MAKHLEDSARMSTPAALSASVSPMLMPWMRSVTSTSGRHQSQYTSGMYRSGEPSKLRLSWAALAASRMRSSSSIRVLSNSATTSRGRKRRTSDQ